MFSWLSSLFFVSRHGYRKNNLPRDYTMLFDVQRYDYEQDKWSSFREKKIVVENSLKFPDNLCLGVLPAWIDSSFSNPNIVEEFVLMKMEICQKKNISVSGLLKNERKKECVSFKPKHPHHLSNPKEASSMDSRFYSMQCELPQLKRPWQFFSSDRNVYKGDPMKDVQYFTEKEPIFNTNRKKPGM